MKYILTILFFWTNIVHATNYYVSAAGSNSNAGTSTGAPWQTLSKVNSFTFASGDSILFRRGDKWIGTIAVGRSNLNFDAYGIGPRPIITGLMSLSGWTEVKPNVYKTSVSCPNDLRYMTIDGIPTEWARTPNKGQGFNSYNYLASYSNGSPKTVTVASLPASPSKVGKRFFVEGFAWSKIIGKVTAHSGSTLTYTNGALNIFGSNPSFRDLSGSGNALIFIGDTSDIDSENEWAYDSTGTEFYIYSTANPSTKVIKVSIVQKLFDLAGFGNISIKNIELEGANGASIYKLNGTGNLTFSNIYFNGSGNKGLALSNCDNVTVEDDTAINCYDNTFMLPKSVGNDNASVKRNSIVNNGPHETMHYNGDDQDGAALVISMNNVEIFDNYIWRSYYHGINFGSGSNASNVEITRNRIIRPSVFAGDCGGIYNIFVNSNAVLTAPTNRSVHDNWVDSSICWPYGRKSIQTGSSKGIYNDARTYNVDYYNNLITNCDMAFANNSPTGVTIRNNTFITSRGVNFRRLNVGNSTDFSIKNNIFSLTSQTAIMYSYYGETMGGQSIAADFAGDVSIDSNICNSGNTAYNADTDEMNSTNYSLTGWRTLTGVSTNDVIVPYLPIAETGRKLVTNWTASTVNVTLNYKYSNYTGTAYNAGTISLPPHSWQLLYYTGPLDGQPQPPLPTNPGDPVRVPWRIP